MIALVEFTKDLVIEREEAEKLKIAYDNQAVDIVEGLQQFQFIFTFSPNAKGIIANLELDLESLPELLAQ